MRSFKLFPGGCPNSSAPLYVGEHVQLRSQAFPSSYGQIGVVERVRGYAVRVRLQDGRRVTAILRDLHFVERHGLMNSTVEKMERESLTPLAQPHVLAS